MPSPRLLTLLLLMSTANIRADDFEADMKVASQTVWKLAAEAQQMANDGLVDQANQRLLSVFPKETRTAVQTLALANMIYSTDPKLSYALHKEAATGLPHNPDVLLEWAMEQHRAGEYAGALAAYDEYSKARPQFAPVHGLAADCLLRLNRTKDAVARWQESERATEGSLDALESLVCEIYKDSTLQLQRSGWFAKAQKGDVDAAVKLVAMDARFERDWWNDGPQQTYLQHDLAMLAKLPTEPRLKAAQCVAECYALEEPSKKSVSAILTRHGLLIDAKKTLPTDGALLSFLVGTALQNGVLTQKQAWAQFGTKLVADGKKEKDAARLNVAASIFSGSKKEVAEMERQAWEATGDHRFAVGYLTAQMARGALKANDPLLAKAETQFPEDCWVWTFAIAVAQPPTEEMLVRGIEAEFHHFSFQPGLEERLSARPLRAYFARLAKTLK